jgi:hypothetical protein
MQALSKAVNEGSAAAGRQLLVQLLMRAHRY